MKEQPVSNKNILCDCMVYKHFKLMCLCITDKVIWRCLRTNTLALNKLIHNALATSDRECPWLVCSRIRGFKRQSCLLWGGMQTQEHCPNGHCFKGSCHAVFSLSRSLPSFDSAVSPCLRSCLALLLHSSFPSALSFQSVRLINHYAIDESDIQCKPTGKLQNTMYFLIIAESSKCA